MDEPVKGRRAYDLSGRLERTRASRESVLRGALALMSAHGYVATTVPQIAEQAGVSVEFIYKQLGDKATLARQCSTTPWWATTTTWRCVTAL